MVVPVLADSDRDDLWLVLPHLGAGGAQKVALMAARHFSAQGMKVKLVTLIPGHPVAHDLPDGIPLLELGVPTHRSWWARAGRFALAQLDKLIRGLFQLQLRWFVGWFQAQVDPGAQGVAMQLFRVGAEATAGFRFRQLRRQFRRQQPHRVLALLSRTNITCCCAAWDLPIHLVVSERNDPSLQLLPEVWQRLRPLAYRRANVVTANTAGVLSALDAMGAWQRLALLPNPLPGAPAPAADSGTANATGFITVARLVPQKGLDVLVEALPRLSGAAAAWPVTVVGDGPERDNLQRQAQDLGVSGRLRWLGFRSDPERFLAEAAVFVLPSRFEGMPNALLEAMAAGLAVIVTDASPGPLEVVELGVSGLVIPSDDPVALAAAMQELAADPERCRRMGAAARQRIAALDWPQLEPLWRSILALS
jgi:glycosyltransferase involved in cell wall biosynthesis